MAAEDRVDILGFYVREVRQGSKCILGEGIEDNHSRVILRAYFPRYMELHPGLAFQ